MSNEELEREVEERAKEIEKKRKENNTTTNSIEDRENNLPTKIEMPNYIPQIDKSKDLSDQASDVVQLMGAQKASTNEEFMDKVSKNFQKGVLTDQEVKEMQKQRLLEQEYFLKWQNLLEFVFIKQPHGLIFMYIMTVIGMFLYVPTRIIGMFIKSIGMFGEFLNEIFNSIFGGKGKYLKNSNGDVILDPNTKKPYIEKQGYNLFAKLLFGIVAIGLCLALVLLFIDLFTGFNVFRWFRSL